jgi:hypothetical protein
MTTENEVVTETVAEPVIDMAAAEQAKRDAERQEQDKIDMAAHKAMLAQMDARIEAEKKIAAEQDAAMQVVKSECDAYRAALKTEEQQ